MESKITILTEDNQPLEIFVIDSTELAGQIYLIATEDDPEDGDDDEEIDVVLLKTEKNASGDFITYTLVDNEKEFEAVMDVFMAENDDYEV